LCEKADAYGTEVARAVGMDSRIGSKFLNASVGFGGSCFQKDILNLVYLCRQYGLNEVADYWQQVVAINDYQKERFVRTMMEAMFNTMAGKRVCLWGFAFKANTGDIRQSPAIYIARRLLAEQAHLVISDPKALPNARLELADAAGHVEYVEDPLAAACGAHAIALLTEWDVYRDVDYEALYKNMVKPAFIFDGRNILPHRRLFEIGFNVYGVGRPHLTHF
jgi:UDPglucose 6-dehydrogenase